jgi:hypothetical protein
MSASTWTRTEVRGAQCDHRHQVGVDLIALAAIAGGEHQAAGLGDPNRAHLTPRLLVIVGCTGCQQDGRPIFGGRA